MRSSLPKSSPLLVVCARQLGSPPLPPSPMPRYRKPSQGSDLKLPAVVVGKGKVDDQQRDSAVGIGLIWVSTSLVALDRGSPGQVGVIDVDEAVLRVIRVKRAREQATLTARGNLAAQIQKCSPQDAAHGRQIRLPFHAATTAALQSRTLAYVAAHPILVRRRWHDSCDPKGMLRRPWSSLLAAGWFAGGSLVFAISGCSSQESTVLQLRAASAGSAQLALTVGDLEIGTVTAVLSRPADDDFPPQTQSIDVQGEHGVISMFFGDLPVGKGYSIELSAGACSGSAAFSIQADTTTLVEVTLTCGDSSEPTGSVQITGTIDAGESAPACDLIAQIVAAPSIQSGDSAPSTVEVVLQPGVSELAVGWVVAQSSSARVVLNTDPASRLKASADCRSSGTAELIATVQALSDGKSCSEEARARIECRDQPELTAPAQCVGDCATPDAGAAPLTSDCASCARSFCGAKLDAVNKRFDAVAPILACVVGADWQRAERAAASSCANADLFGCYCGSVAPAMCGSAAPATLDGQCRDLLLAGSGCSDSACLQTNLLNPATTTGIALEYLQCQQDFCYDLCFNP